MATSPETREHNDAVPVQLRESGLLWLINATTFHPQGFSLGISEEGDFYLTGDGSEPITFEDTPTMHAKFRAAHQLFRQLRKGF